MPCKLGLLPCGTSPLTAPHSEGSGAGQAPRQRAARAAIDDEHRHRKKHLLTVLPYSPVITCPPSARESATALLPVGRQQRRTRWRLIHCLR